MHRVRPPIRRLGRARASSGPGSDRDDRARLTPRSARAIDTSRRVWGQWIARPLSNGPFLLRRLHQVGAADPKRIDTLTQDGILTPADLELALAEGRPSVGVPSLRQFADTIADQQPPGLGRAHDILTPVLTQLTRMNCGLESLIASGDIRRYVAQPRHLVAVGLSSDPSRVIAAAASLPDFTEIVHRSRRRLIAIGQEHEIDL